MSRTSSFCILAMIVLSGLSFLAKSAPASAEYTITAELATAPNVPLPITRTISARVVVNLEAKEFVGTLAEGVKYKFWSFNGTVPGPMIRVRVGDTVELHLKNSPDSTMPHNIDLHAVNGPGGGAAVSLVVPGQEAVFQFKAMNPGLFIYHCASPAPNIPTHIANGMYGLILVEPLRGLAKADREFYVMQSEFFTEPSEVPGVSKMSMEKGLAEHPDYVVFNGRAGALLGNGALKAKPGETVRVFFGNIGPNGVSSFHIIGEIFDKVYVEGSLNGVINWNIQTTLVPSAGAVIVESLINVPGTYLLVDHSIFRVAKGAVGALVVEGPEDPAVFKSIKKP
jgi:nitrite reductase (NO-forming)